MSQVRPIESMKSSAREAAHRFSGKPALWMTAIVLAASGAAYTIVEAVVSDTHDDTAAQPFIRADGFKDPTDLGETIGGGVISMDSLRAAECTFYGVDADLVYRHGKVVGVDDYQIPLRGATVTVQNAAELRQAAPYLHC
jgi:hypothetical protein